MNEENTTIMPPEKQIVQDDRDARAEELESAFSYDGYQVVRKELFAHLRDPAIVIRKDNRKMKQIAVQACGAEESGAHRVGKPDESNSGEIKCMALVRMIYGDSGWDKKMSYRLIGRAFPQQRLVSFKITDAMQIENGRVLTEM